MPNKLYAQYRNKPKAIAWSNIPLDLTTQAKTVAEQVSNSYSIDDNSGVHLDVIGEVVARDRGFISTLKFDVQELNDDGDFECGDEDVQMSPVSVANDSDLSNQHYRYLLKSKIVKNNSDATLDEILTAINLAIPDMNATRLIDGEDMTFSIEFYGSIDEIARDLLISGDLVPRPQGVEFRGFLEGVNLVECNDSGDFECGDDSTEMVGFIEVI
ncbi:structural protein [Vibrio phage 97E33-1]